MLAEERMRRQGELENYITQLAAELLDDEAGIRSMTLKMLEIYKGDFRHGYAGFFPLITEISKNKNTDSLEKLSANLESIRLYVEQDFVSGRKEFQAIYDQINKLFDHINTEIGRWNYYSQNEQKIEDVKCQSVSLSASITVARHELEKASKQASSIQTELIAVLSIFAAIVVTFSGGFTFLGSVMTSINGVKYYEIVVMVAIICGMVIFNTIFLLMYLVGKITDRNIYAKCDTDDCSCENKCGNLTRIRKRLPYVFYFNLLAVCGIVLDLAIWYFDMRGWLGV